MDGAGLSQVYHNIEQKSADLPDHRGDGRSCHSERGKSEKTKDEDGIQDDVDHASRDQQAHGDLHLPDALEDLLKSDLKQRSEREAEYNISVSTGIIEHCRIVREQREERTCDDKPADDEKDAVEYSQPDPDGGGPVCLFLIFRAEMDRDCGTDAHADPHCHGQNRILERIGKGDRGQRVGS